MHAKQAGTVEARQERTLRRRRLAGEQQAASEALEQQSKLDTLLASLYKQSAEERRIAERLAQLRREEEVLEQNRAQRLRQYDERRERDWEEALARERQLMDAMKVRATVVALPCAPASNSLLLCLLRWPRHAGTYVHGVVALGV